MLARRPEEAEYPHSVASVWRASVEAAEGRCASARPLLELLVFLAPEAVPRGLLGAEPEALPGSLRDPAERDEAIGALHRFFLVHAAPETLTVHRLVQAVTRDGLDEATAKARAEAAVRLAGAAWPGDPLDYKLWSQISTLLPHVLVSTGEAERLGVALRTTAALLNHAALYHKVRGGWGEAEPLYKRAIAIDEKTLGPQDPELATSLNGLAIFYKSAGRYAEAEPLLKRAINIRERALGPEHPDVASSLNSLAGLYHAMGNCAAAEPLIKRGLAIAEKSLPPNHPHIKIFSENYAFILGTLGRSEEASALRTQVEEIRPPSQSALARGSTCASGIIGLLRRLFGAAR